MNEIGTMLKTARESSGVSLEEASEDLKIKTIILENIEDGNIGCFKDIFVLKDYICNYAKYLGLDPAKTIDHFNECVFEITSKIPIKDIEKAISQKDKEVVGEKIISPYTVAPQRISKTQKTILIVILTILVLLITIWSVKQIAISSEVTNVIVYAK